MGPDRHFDPEADLPRYEALLETADVMVRSGSLAELFPELAKRLHQVVAFDLASFSLHDPVRNVMQLHVWEGREPGRAPAESPIGSSPSGWAWQNQQALVVSDLESESRFPRVFEVMRARGIRSYCALPLTTSQKKLGALALGSSRLNAYGEMDLRLLRRVAEMVAMAVENVLTREALQAEKKQLETLLEVNTALASNLDPQRVFPAISQAMHRVINHQYASVAVYDDVTQSLHIRELENPSHRETTEALAVLPVREAPAGHAFLQRETKIFSHEDLIGAQSGFVSKMLGQGIRSLCCIPLVTRKGTLGTLNLASTEEDAFTSPYIDLLQQVAVQVAIALDNVRAYGEIAELRDKLAEEKLYLESEIRSELNFEEIVGESAALRQVLAQAKTVAPSDATVLILGETGTGKELIARAIHRMSARQDTSFIKLNCAAIPTGLLESELFGHEKGAFTGAITQKVGRLELADRGTLFLDEVGDIPLEVQPKLLRVLQDQEFERLGSTRTLRVNLRLIAATNRDLAKSVAEHQFRSDLYYRLHVFPIRMPALRERKEDIPLLVHYFVQKLARRMNKSIKAIPTETMNSLVAWEWPGNVRELENFIERSVILSSGSVLTVPLAELVSVPQPAYRDGTLESMEREHIVRVLRETGGLISGIRGAAARLGVKRTTLQSRMQKMGIRREEYEN